MMKVTKLDDVEAIQYKSEKVTEYALQNEHDYLLAEKLTMKLLEKSLITQSEFDKIMAKNRIKFSSFLAEIMS